MRAPLLALSVPLVACMQIGTGNGLGSDGGASTASGSAALDAGVQGASCFVDPATQTVLCEQISVCPGVAFDPGVLPDCGFRLHGASPLDPECLCGDSLCPVGVPTSCAQAAQLLSAQSSLTVCQQQDEGRCVSLAAPEAGVPGSCDTVCREECGGVPSCLQLCGC